MPHQAFRAAVQALAFAAELVPDDQEQVCLPPEEYGRALRAAYEHERVVLAQKGE